MEEKLDAKKCRAILGKNLAQDLRLAQRFTFQQNDNLNHTPRKHRSGFGESWSIPTTSVWT